MAVTPIIRTVHANGVSPSTLFQKLSSPFLLESREAGWFDGKYSLIGLAPFAVFQHKGQETCFTPLEGKQNAFVWKQGDPLVLLQECLDRFKPYLHDDSNLPDNLPLLQGGAVGFISYDLIRQYESLPSYQEERGLPDIHMVFINHFILFDHLQQIYYIVYNPAPLVVLGLPPQEADRIGHTKIEAVLKRFETSDPGEGALQSPTVQKMTHAISEEEYVTMVERAQTYIAAGDIYQANLSQYFHTPYDAPSLFPIYRRLHQINPSPFAAYLKMGGVEIASASPERLLRITNDTGGAILETHPLAGTRPRGKTEDEDQAQIKTLYGSEKERAEHLMLVDLERNDVGKVSQYGSVKVDALLALTRCSHVFHLASHIRGTLHASIRAADVLRAMFPGGTITGVPKIRCMQIIAELEKQPRGLYTGSIGYIAFTGETDMNIVIRTFIRQGNTLSFHVGAGIVADSDPVMEYQETLHKAKALLAALEPFE